MRRLFTIMALIGLVSAFGCDIDLTKDKPKYCALPYLYCQLSTVWNGSLVLMGRYVHGDALRGQYSLPNGTYLSRDGIHWEDKGGGFPAIWGNDASEANLFSFNGRLWARVRGGGAAEQTSKRKYDAIYVSDDAEEWTMYNDRCPNQDLGDKARVFAPKYPVVELYGHCISYTGTGSDGYFLDYERGGICANVTSDMKTWSTYKTNLPAGLFGFTVTNVNGKLYAVGGAYMSYRGVSRVTYQSIDWVFVSDDGVSWTRADAYYHFPPRAFHSVAALDGEMFVAGGGAYPYFDCSDIYSSPLDDLMDWNRRYERGAYGQKGDLWRGGEKRVLFAADGKLVLVGGNYHRNCLDYSPGGFYIGTERYCFNDPAVADIFVSEDGGRTWTQAAGRTND